MSSDRKMLFVTLGMFIIDEIHYPDKPSKYNILGGGGLFSTLGSRIALSLNDPSKCAMIIDEGSDFPESAREKLNKWNSGIVFRKDTSRLTTRGWNNYKENDFREFKYMTPKKRIDIEDLQQYPALLKSESLHFICSPQRCEEMVKKLIKAQNNDASEQVLNTVIIWEPIPDLCTLENLPACQRVLKYVDILTPNSEEASRFFGLPEYFTKPEIESVGKKFLPYLAKKTNKIKSSGIAIRCGALGILVMTNDGYQKWFPAYQAVNPEAAIVDCTGAGNTSCGAFVTALCLTSSWEIAAIVANIAAGICIETLDMPKLEGCAKWNGVEFEQRLRNYLRWSGLSSDISSEFVLQELSRTIG